MPEVQQIKQSVNTNSVSKKIILRRIFRRYLSFIIILVLAGTSFYFYRKTQNNPNAVSQAEVKSLVSKVGKLVVLPEGETPTIATVSDPEALSDQAFFADAKKGDKVLIYSNAKKAILYSPNLDKIITIAPLNTDTSKNPTVTPSGNTDTAKSDKKN